MCSITSKIMLCIHFTLYKMLDFLAICRAQDFTNSPGWVAQLARVASQYTKIAGPILVRAHTRSNQ